MSEKPDTELLREAAQRLLPGDDGETQETVSAWCQECYPGESLRKKAINGLEEMVELCRAIGLSEDDIVAAAQASAKKTPRVGRNRRRFEIQCEIGDVAIALDDLATVAGESVQGCKNMKMARNREFITPEIAAERSQRKQALGLKG